MGCGKPSKMNTPSTPIRIGEVAAVGKKNDASVPRPTSKLRIDMKVRDVYKMGKTLGTGGFAVVKLATDKQTGEEFACKIMALPEPNATAGDNENTREDIFKEIDILVGLEHENVIFLKEYFEEGNKVYLITELLMGGELLDAVLERGSYTEADARNCFIQLLKGIKYLHDRNIVHRDLKLENLLLATADDITKIKIADFGLAKKAAESAMDTICGTPQYVAPEVIQGSPGLVYNAAVDLWSAGVVLFILLGGYPPFYDESEPALFEQIRRGGFSFDDPVWDTISENAKDLIRKLLLVNPKERLSADGALRHKWISEVMEHPANLGRTQDNIRRQFRNKFKGAVHNIIAQQRMAGLVNLAKSGELGALQKSTGSNDLDVPKLTAEAAKSAPPPVRPLLASLPEIPSPLGHESAGGAGAASLQHSPRPIPTPA